MTTDLPLRARARQLYRALLRELPRRHISLSSPRSSPRSSPSSSSSPLLKQRFRERFISPPPPPSTTTTPTAAASHITLHQQIQQAEQFVQYAKAQRMYATLLQRYNPGMEMDQEERVRLTARRVGMDLPVENNTNNNERDGDEYLGGGERKE